MACLLIGRWSVVVVKRGSRRADHLLMGLLEQLTGLSIFGRTPTPRAARRFRIEDTGSTLGAIVDVSATGCRVRCAGVPTLVKGQGVPLRIQSGTTVLSLSALVVWAGRVSQGWEVGLRFVGVGRAEAHVLKHLCEFGCFPSGAGVHGGGAEAAPAAAARVEIEDLYAVLGVRSGSSGEEVRRAYHRLAHELHPDHNRDDGAAERFALVSKAYSVLRDAGTRGRYDAMLSGVRRAA
ncbi:MAG: DnaJ domain-containing protein [Phycisphaerales bacterium]